MPRSKSHTSLLEIAADKLEQQAAAFHQVAQETGSGKSARHLQTKPCQFVPTLQAAPDGCTRRPPRRFSAVASHVSTPPPAIPPLSAAAPDPNSGSSSPRASPECRRGVRKWSRLAAHFMIKRPETLDTDCAPGYNVWYAMRHTSFHCRPAIRRYSSGAMDGTVHDPLRSFGLHRCRPRLHVQRYVNIAWSASQSAN
jgi:hypothetical protein